MRSRILFLAAFAVVLAWLALAIETFVLLGLADREKTATQMHSMVEKEAPYAEARAKGLIELDPSKAASEVQNELEVALWSNAVVIGLGVIAVLTGLVLRRYLTFAVLISSLLYWGLWYRYGFSGDVSIVEAYRLKWLAASSLNYVGTFFFKDVVLPIVFTASTIACIATMIWSYRYRGG